MNEWLTIREAAQNLGVSDLTIRRRIKDGRIEHTLREGKYYVRLSTANQDGMEDTSSPTAKKDIVARDVRSPDNGSKLSRLHVDALIARQAGLAQSAGRAAQLEEQLHALEARYQELQQGTIALATRNGWLESKLEEREKDLKLLEDAQYRRPWLKRLFGGSSNGSRA